MKTNILMQKKKHNKSLQAHGTPYRKSFKLASQTALGFLLKLKMKVDLATRLDVGAAT